MRVKRRELAIGVAVTATLLWVSAVAVGAPFVAVVLPVLGLMAAGVLLVIADHATDA